MKSILGCVACVGAFLATNVHAGVVNYQLTGIFDTLPQVSVYDDSMGGDLDTTDWGLLPQLFGAPFSLTFDLDEDSLLTGTSGGVQAAFFNFAGAASNVSLVVQGNPFASATSGDVSQVLAQASHTWALDAAGTLAGPSLELFDFFNSGYTGYFVGQPLLNLALIDSEQTAFSAGADNLIALTEGVFLGDAPVGFITDSLTLFLSGGTDDVTVDYNITGTISSITAVPLPATVWLLATGVTGLALRSRRRVAIRASTK